MAPILNGQNNFDEHGDYLDSTGNDFPACYDVMEVAAPYVMEAIGDIPFDAESGGAFHVADFGTADGGTSRPLICDIIGKIKEKYGGDQEVQINYEDQPLNDYNSMFLRMHGISTNEKAWFDKYKGVFFNVCSTGFHCQCFPKNSVHLGFSATAMHWLSRRPCHIQSAIHHTGITDENEKRLYAEEAKKSWDLILMNRAKEIVPGGHMVICMLGIDEKGQSSGQTHRVKCKKFEVFSNIWRAMVTDGIITEKEFVEATCSDYWRTFDEVTEPFKNEHSPVFKQGLRLVDVKTCILDCPLNLAWIKSKKTPDDTAACMKHAKKFVSLVRRWSDFIFMSGLDSSRTEEDKNNIVDEVYLRYEREIAKNPADHAQDLVHHYVHFKKLK